MLTQKISIQLSRLSVRMISFNHMCGTHMHADIMTHVVTNREDILIFVTLENILFIH